MTFEELMAKLEATNYPVTYYEFKVEVEPPFICVNEIDSETFGSDTENLMVRRYIDIELYSSTLNEVAEGKIKAVLSSIAFEMSRTKIDSESLLQTVFSIELIEKLRSD